jgi:hypothetical protein
VVYGFPSCKNPWRFSNAFAETRSRTGNCNAIDERTYATYHHIMIIGGNHR